MKLPFFKKSFEQVTNAQINDLLKALYQFNKFEGVANVIQDNPTSYLTEGYAGNSDVFSIINRIVRMQEQAHLGLYRLDKKTGQRIEITDHELSKFTRAANPTMSMDAFREAYFVYKLSIGNVYLYKPILESGLNKGKTLEVWMMPSNNMEIYGSGNWMNPIGYYILMTNTTVKFKPEEVYHSKFFNPLFGSFGSLYGMSPLKAAAKTVSKQNEAEQTELKQFENQSPPYMLYRDIDAQLGGLTDDQRGQIEGILKKYRKQYKSGQPLVLPDKFGMIRLGVSPADLKILESSKEGRRVLCNIYGMPSELFNDTESKVYNSMKEAKKDAWANCIAPNLNGFARDLTSFLVDSVPEYVKDGLFYGIDYSGIPELQEDLEKKVNWMVKAFWNPNQILQATGKPRVEDPLMDEPIVPMGVSFLSDYTDQGAGSSASLDNAKKDFGDYEREETKQNQ